MRLSTRSDRYAPTRFFSILRIPTDREIAYKAPSPNEAERNFLGLLVPASSTSVCHTLAALYPAASTPLAGGLVIRSEDRGSASDQKLKTCADGSMVAPIIEQ